MHQDNSLRLAIGGMLAMATAMGIGRFVYTPILPTMIEGLSWTKSEAGIVASANFLGYLIGAMLTMRPVAPRLQRTGLLAALLVSALTTIAMAISPNFIALAILRLIGGGASAFVIVLASTLILAQLSQSGRGHLTSFQFAGVGAGIMISAAIVSLLLAAGGGWQALWFGVGALALLFTGLTAVLIPAHLDTVAAAPDAIIKPPKKGLPLFITAYGLYGFGYIITTTFLVTTVRLTPELRELEAWIWILFGFAAVPSVALWTWIGARIGLVTAFAVACLIEAVGVAASVEWISVAGICVAAVLLGGTFMGLTALGIIAARELAGTASQRAIALMTASFATGQMIGPAVAGYLYDELGSLRVPTLAAALALVLAAVLSLWLQVLGSAEK